MRLSFLVTLKNERKYRLTLAAQLNSFFYKWQPYTFGIDLVLPKSVKLELNNVLRKVHNQVNL